MKGKISVPLSTCLGEYQCEDESGVYLLYDYIEGETIGDQACTDSQVHQLAKIIAELHSYGEEIPIETNAIKEDFEVRMGCSIYDVLPDIGRTTLLCPKPWKPPVSCN